LEVTAEHIGLPRPKVETAFAISINDRCPASPGALHTAVKHTWRENGGHAAISRRPKFALDQARSFETTDNARMPNLVFTCPMTKTNVQFWLDEDDDIPDSEYEAVRCKVCGMLHLINRKTGKLLDQKKDSPQAGG
jgi:hypothetical protein